MDPISQIYSKIYFNKIVYWWKVQQALCLKCVGDWVLFKIQILWTPMVIVVNIINHRRYLYLKNIAFCYFQKLILYKFISLEIHFTINYFKISLIFWINVKLNFFTFDLSRILAVMVPILNDWAHICIKMYIIYILYALKTKKNSWCVQLKFFFKY